MRMGEGVDTINLAGMAQAGGTGHFLGGNADTAHAW